MKPKGPLLISHFEDEGRKVSTTLVPLYQDPYCHPTGVTGNLTDDPVRTEQVKSTCQPDKDPPGKDLLTPRVRPRKHQIEVQLRTSLSV